MKFQLISTKYINNNNKPGIMMYGRSDDGSSVSHVVSGFAPYFYIKPTDFDMACRILEEIPEVESFHPVMKFLPIGFQTEKTKVIKVIVYQPSQVPRVRDFLQGSEFIEECYEADVLYATQRFLTDFNIGGMQWIETDGNEIKGLDIQEDAPIRILGFDIEVCPPVSGVPNPKEDPIIMISISFNNGKSMVLVAKHGNDNEVIKFCNDEYWMLETFCDIIKDYDPDVIMSFNGFMFDYPYILERMDILQVCNNFGRDGSPFVIKEFGSKREVNIIGRVSIDLLEAIKNNYSLNSYSLENVSKELLNRPKLDIKASQMRHIWLEGSESELQEFIDYAVRDADLLQDIINQLKLIDRYISISKESGLLLHEVINGGQSRRIESLLLKEFYKEDRLWPLKTRKKQMGESVEGATVFEPERGLQEKLIVMDYKSLYPSAIRAFNICWSSIIDDENVGIKTILAPNNVRYSDHSVYEGIMPRILTRLYNKRVALKKMMKETDDQDEKEFYDNQQYAVKILLNSFYGYTGAPSGRLYEPRLANSVTSVGRMAIALTKETAESLVDCRVVGGDSVTADRFVTLKKSDGNIVIRNMESLFDELSSNGIILHGEKEYAVCKGEYFALSFDTDLNPVWNSIRCVMRHKNSKRIYRVIQKYGETRVTEDHSIMTYLDDRLIETKPTDIIGKRKIASIIENIDHDSNNIIDLYKYIKHYKYGIVYKKREKIVCFKLVDNGKRISFGWTNRKNEVSIKRYVSGNDLEKLCRLMGAFVSEGAASNHLTNSCGNAIFSISCGDEEWLRQLRDDYFSLVTNMIYPNILRTNKELKYYKDHEYEDNTLSLRIGNQFTCAFFSALCGQGCRNKRLPDFVFNIDTHYQQIIYENMLKGDGSIDKKGRISYSSLSLELISDLTLLLNMMNKKYSLSYNQSKGEYRLRETYSHDDNQVSTKIIEEEYDGYVYDITVDNDHMFVDSCGQILLHNTDSVFIKLNNIKTPDEGKEKAKIIHDAMLTKLPPPMEIDFECWAERAIIFEKKRYAMWIFEPSKDGWKDKMKYRGIEVRRRDWVKLVGETMDKVLHMVLQEGDVTGSWNLTNSVIEEVRGLKDIRTNDDLANKLILSRKVGDLNKYKNVQPHVTVCKKMQSRGEQPYGLGDRAMYMALPGASRGNISELVDTPEWIRNHGNGRIDSEWYIENQLKPPLERLFEAIGIDINTGKKILDQESLFGYEEVEKPKEVIKPRKQKVGLFAFK